MFLKYIKISLLQLKDVKFASSALFIINQYHPLKIKQNLITVKSKQFFHYARDAFSVWYTESFYKKCVIGSVWFVCDNEMNFTSNSTFAC